VCSSDLAMLDHQHGAPGIDGVGAIPHVRRQVGDGAVGGHLGDAGVGGIVVEDVDATVALKHLGNQAANIVLVHQVKTIGKGLATVVDDVPRHLGGAIEIDIGKYHLRTRRGEGSGTGFADIGARPTDDGHTAVQFFCV